MESTIDTTLKAGEIMNQIVVAVISVKSPWFMGIVSGMVLILIGVVFFSLSEYRKRKIRTAHRKMIMENAQHLLEDGQVDEALAIFTELLSQISRLREPKIYAQVKHKEGVCYKHLASTTDAAENLKKAILCYEEAIKILDLNNDPLEYSEIQNDLGAAYGTLAELEDKVIAMKDLPVHCIESEQLLLGQHQSAQAVDLQFGAFLKSAVQELTMQTRIPQIEPPAAFRSAVRMEHQPDGRFLENRIEKDTQRGICNLPDNQSR